MHLRKESGLPWWLSGTGSACQAGDMGSVPGLGRFPGEGNGNALQYSCQENPMDRTTWRATVHGVAKSQTQLSAHTHTHTRKIYLQYMYLPWTSLVAQTVKRLSTMWETQVRALGWEDSLEKETAIHSRTIAWRIP